MGGRLVQPYQNIQAVPSKFWGAPVLRAQGDQESTGIKAGELYCPGFIGPTFTQNAWDTVQIKIPAPFMTGVLQQWNADRLPGTSLVSVKKGRQLDRKKSSGSDGQRLTFTGINNADVEIQVTIWTPQQLEILLALWRVIQPQVGKGAPSAFDCYHPNLETSGVKSLVFVDSVGFADAPGRSKTFRIAAVEYFPPGNKRVTSTANKSYSRGSVLDEGAYRPPGKNPSNVGP